MVLTQRQFCSPGTCGNVRRHFRLSPWGKGVTGIQQVDPRDAAQHPELHGTVPTTKNSLVPNVLLLRFYLFIFRERGREGEREGEKHQCVVASRAPPTGDLAHNPGMCPDCESNQQPFGSQACAQSTEIHQQGPLVPNVNSAGVRSRLGRQKVGVCCECVCTHSCLSLFPTHLERTRE